MRISDWSSDVCSSYLQLQAIPDFAPGSGHLRPIWLRLDDAVTLLGPGDWAVIALSLKVSGVAVVVSLPLAFALAWLLARGRFPCTLLLDGLVHRSEERRCGKEVVCTCRIGGWL